MTSRERQKGTIQQRLQTYEITPGILHLADHIERAQFPLVDEVGSVLTGRPFSNWAYRRGLGILTRYLWLHRSPSERKHRVKADLDTQARATAALRRYVTQGAQGAIADANDGIDAIVSLMEKEAPEFGRFRLHHPLYRAMIHETPERFGRNQVLPHSSITSMTYTWILNNGPEAQEAAISDLAGRLLHTSATQPRTVFDVTSPDAAHAADPMYGMESPLTMEEEYFLAKAVANPAYIPAMYALLFPEDAIAPRGILSPQRLSAIRIDPRPVLAIYTQQAGISDGGILGNANRLALREIFQNRIRLPIILRMMETDGQLLHSLAGVPDIAASLQQAEDYALSMVPNHPIIDALSRIDSAMGKRPSATVVNRAIDNLAFLVQDAGVGTPGVVTAQQQELAGSSALSVLLDTFPSLDDQAQTAVLEELTRKFRGRERNKGQWMPKPLQLFLERQLGSSEIARNTYYTHLFDVIENGIGAQRPVSADQLSSVYGELDSALKKRMRYDIRAQQGRETVQVLVSSEDRPWMIALAQHTVRNFIRRFHGANLQIERDRVQAGQRSQLLEQLQMLSQLSEFFSTRLGLENDTEYKQLLDALQKVGKFYQATRRPL